MDLAGPIMNIYNLMQEMKQSVTTSFLKVTTINALLNHKALIAVMLKSNSKRLLKNIKDLF